MKRSGEKERFFFFGGFGSAPDGSENRGKLDDLKKKGGGVQGIRGGPSRTDRKIGSNHNKMRRKSNAHLGGRGNVPAAGGGNKRKKLSR